MEITKGIQAVETAARILGVLAVESHPVPLRHIAAVAGIPPNNLRFYLISLLKTELVAQDPVSGCYSLGPAIIGLGLSALAQFDIVHSARRELHRLADSLGFTAFLTVWGNRGPVAVDRVDGRVRTVLEIRVGTVFPMRRSAVGRCFLSTLPQSECDLALKIEHDAAGTGPYRDNAIAEEVARLRADFERDGVTAARGLLLSEFTAMAAPILDRAGFPLATLSIVGPVGILDDDPSGQPAKLLREACNSLSGQLGWRTERAVAGKIAEKKISVSQRRPPVDGRL
tara:strand:- start:41648 stop:42499 length:852 start_codon:yes stop_codon:yes gene_type:complete